ncbi:hypothetical protein GYMLUDRAFT_242873 [Collybiopsis luxurians FD-317 M1]|uniref:Uncharacterized protein n=1 Tax=Collybiopsis luxurians FD-317 M1 TaxID=944289 RepID=A0A0D0C272_9AGAR|nr:hypothetical protein GYMLUDRAFT_242873 [Collybiopsis luxurians FD-317 M1]
MIPLAVPATIKWDTGIHVIIHLTQTSNIITMTTVMTLPLPNSQEPTADHGDSLPPNSPISPPPSLTETTLSTPSCSSVQSRTSTWSSRLSAPGPAAPAGSSFVPATTTHQSLVIPHPSDIIQPACLGWNYNVVFLGTQVGIFGDWYQQVVPYTVSVSGSHQCGFK